MMSVHSCLRGRILVHLLEEWRFSVNLCVRGKIPVHSLEEWWFRFFHVWGIGYRCTEEWQSRCIHVWQARFRCIYLRDDDFGAFMCEGYDISVSTRGVTSSVHLCMRGKIPVHLLEGWWFPVHSCVRGRISVHLPEEWRYRYIHVWEVRFRCIYLRDDDFGAFMYEG